LNEECPLGCNIALIMHPPRYTHPVRVNKCDFPAKNSKDRSLGRKMYFYQHGCDMTPDQNLTVILSDNGGREFAFVSETEAICVM